MKYDAEDLDVLTRTVIGEGAGESDIGQRAIVNTIFNRTKLGSKNGFSDKLSQTAKQNLQYSAWNDKNIGGNDLVRKYGPGTQVYERARKNVEYILQNQDVDYTGGAVNYMAPAGMKKWGVFNSEKNRYEPRWWASKLKGKDEIIIGNHVFIGDKKKVKTE